MNILGILVIFQSPTRVGTILHISVNSLSESFFRLTRIRVVERAEVADEFTCNAEVSHVSMHLTTHIDYLPNTTFINGRVMPVKTEATAAASNMSLSFRSV
jgi:hypothetical protein